jgi:hypothetical protein
MLVGQGFRLLKIRPRISAIGPSAAMRCQRTAKKLRLRNCIRKSLPVPSIRSSIQVGLG